jgi:hypothetical protein
MTGGRCGWEGDGDESDSYNLMLGWILLLWTKGQAYLSSVQYESTSFGWENHCLLSLVCVFVCEEAIWHPIAA